MNESMILDQFGQPMASSTSYLAAGVSTKAYRNWQPDRSSADQDLLPELDTLVARSQDLTRNNGVASGYSQTMIDNVVGPELRLAAMPNYLALGKDKEWASEWSRVVEAAFKLYASSTDFDASQQETFGSMTQNIFRASLIQGEATIIPYWLQGREYRTCFMHFDSSRLDNPAGQLDTTTLRRGVKLGSHGEPLGYHVKKSTPNDIGLISYTGDWEYISARTKSGRRRFIHVFEKKRPGQTRGEPVFSSVMGDFKMAGEYQTVELETAISNSLISAFIQSSMDIEDVAAAFGADWDPTQYLEDRQSWQAKLSGGSMVHLPVGDSVQPFTPSRPAAAFGAFMEYSYRNLATGLNVPYELLMKDFSKVNYSSARAAMLEAWRTFMGRRQWLSTYWAQPVYELWLEEAVLRGQIEAPDFYKNKAAYCQSRWIGPGRGWVDIVKEAKGSELKMKIGVSTQQDECAEQGKDWEQVQDQRAAEVKRGIEVAKAQNLPESMGLVIAGFASDSSPEPIENYFIPEDEDKKTDDNSNRQQPVTDPKLEEEDD